jgi:hypothetical protein
MFGMNEIYFNNGIFKIYTDKKYINTTNNKLNQGVKNIVNNLFLKVNKILFTFPIN